MQGENNTLVPRVNGVNENTGFHRIGAMNLYRMGIDYLVPDTVTAE